MEIIFLDDWDTGGKFGKRTLNDRRLIKKGSCEYYEFKIGDDIAICDIDSLHLLDTYRWNICMTQDGKKYIRSSVRQGDKIAKLYFSRLVLNESGGNVEHINKNTLDVRKQNLRVVRAKINPETDYVVDPVDKKKVSKSLAPGFQSKWSEGKLGGSVNNMSDKSWRVAFQNPLLNKYFFFSTHGGKAVAKEKALQFRKEEAIRRGLVRNRYRTITTSDGDVYLEVEATHKDETKSFFCDVEDVGTVKECKWYIQNRTGSENCEVRTSTGKHRTFHSALGIYKVTDHIDGNPLNNRRCNLRDGIKYNPRNHSVRKDNESGTTGVSFRNSSNAWVVQWPEDGKRKSKSFGIIKNKRTREEALEMARAFRIEIDKKLNLHEQQYL